MDAQPFFCFFFIPFVSPAVLSRFFPVISQIQGHIAGSPPPSPLRYVLSFFIARRTQHFLPSLTRVELCVPMLLGALSSCYFSCIFENIFKISPRWASNSRTNASSIRGQPLDHRSDRLECPPLIAETNPSRNCFDENDPFNTIQHCANPAPPLPFFLFFRFECFPRQSTTRPLTHPPMRSRTLI